MVLSVASLTVGVGIKSKAGEGPKAKATYDSRHGGQGTLDTDDTQNMFNITDVIQRANRGPEPSPVLVLKEEQVLVDRIGAEKLAKGAMKTHLNVVNAANQKHIPVNYEGEIPREYWTKAIQDLHPLSVYYMGGVNIAAALKYDVQGEVGIVIETLISNVGPAYTLTGIGSITPLAGVHSIFAYKRTDRRVVQGTGQRVSVDLVDGSIPNGLLQTYLAIVKQRIEEYFKLPYPRPGVQCVIQFQIEKDGTINSSSIKIVNPSGFSNLDSLAVQTLVSTRLPPLYDGMKTESLPVIVTFRSVGDTKADSDHGKTVSEADKREAENLAARGWRLWNQRKLAEAEEAFKKAVEKDPTRTNAWNGLGWAQQNQGKPLNAKYSFEQCLKLDPKHPAALNGLGWIAKGEGKTDEAIGYWKRAVDAAPGATAALAGLADTYLDQKNYPRSRAVLRAVAQGRTRQRPGAARAGKGPRRRRPASRRSVRPILNIGSPSSRIPMHQGSRRSM